MVTRWCRSWRADGSVTSSPTTKVVRTNRWRTEHRRRCTRRVAGRRDAEAFVSAPHDLSGGEGRAGRKRRPGEQAERKWDGKN
jgi:hypothetical protein